MTRNGYERVGVRARAGLVLAAAAGLACGCGGSPPTKPGDTTDPKPDPRTAVPETCVQNVWCDVRPAEPVFADTSKLPLWGPLGCGPVYSFHNGIGGGTGSLCLDTPEHRTLLHDNHQTGFLPAGCSPPPKATRCLKLPEGMVFVIWTRMAPPPFCPSTCQDISAPAPF